MTARTFRAFQAEAVRTLFSRGPYVGAAIVAAAAAAAGAVNLAGAAPLGYPFVAYATGISFGFAGLPLILGFSAVGVAGDVHSGAVRLVLTRPITRYDYLAAKLFVALIYAALLLVVAAVPAWALAAWTGGLGGVAFGGEVVYTARDMQQSYLLGAALAAAPAAAAAAYGLLWSTAVRAPATALAGAVGSWLLLDAVKYPLGIDRALFWSYWTFPWEDFRSRSDALPFDGGEGALLTAAVSGAWFVVCIAGAGAIFRRRNL